MSSSVDASRLTALRFLGFASMGCVSLSFLRLVVTVSCSERRALRLRTTSFEDEVEEETVSKPEKRAPPRRRSVERTSKRVPVQTKEAAQAKELLQQSSNEVVRKRRARRSEHDTVTTKRRKLSETQPIDAKPRKRRAVKRDASTEDDMDETLKRFVAESPEE